MRLRYSLLLAALVAAPVASGQVLLEENFAYPAGTAMGGTGTSPTPPNATTGWATHSGTTGQLLVDATGLTFTSTPAYPSQSGGAIHLLSSQGEDISHTFAAQTSGSVYVSALVRPDAVPNSAVGSYFLHVAATSVSGTTFRGRVFVAASAVPGNVTFGVSTAGNTPVLGTTNVPLGTTVLVVLRYDIVDGASNDASRIYVLPAGSNIASEPLVPEAVAVDTNTDPADIGAVAIREGTTSAPGGNTGDLTIDGVRVSKSWPAVATASDDVARPGDQQLAVWGRRVRVTMDTPGSLDVALYDVLGRQVATLFQGAASGVAEAMLPEGLTPGVYVVRATGAGFAQSKAVVIR